VCNDILKTAENSQLPVRKAKESVRTELRQREFLPIYLAIFVPLLGKLCVCGVFEDLAVWDVHLSSNCVNFEIFLNNYSKFVYKL
jgi:hypothetical protein